MQIGRSLPDRKITLTEAQNAKEVPMDDSRLFFDLTQFRVCPVPEDPRAMSDGWLMIDSGSPEQTLHYQHAFLVSLNARDNHPLLLKGSAGGFQEALRFFTQITQGRIDAALPGRLCAYFATSPTEAGNRESSPKAAFAHEKTHFAAQFELPGPKQGLRGFLEKNKQPFHNEDTQVANASLVVTWLTTRLKRTDNS